MIITERVMSPRHVAATQNLYASGSESTVTGTGIGVLVTQCDSEGDLDRDWDPQAQPEACTGSDGISKLPIA